MYFMYVKWNGKLIGQKCDEMWRNSETKKEYPHMQKFKLTEEDSKLTIDELKMKYPLTITES